MLDRQPKAHQAPLLTGSSDHNCGIHVHWIWYSGYDGCFSCRLLGWVDFGGGDEEEVRADQLQPVLLCEGDRIPATPLFQRRAVLWRAVRHGEGLCACGLLEEEERWGVGRESDLRRESEVEQERIT